VTRKETFSKKKKKGQGDAFMEKIKSFWMTLAIDDEPRCRGKKNIKRKVQLQKG